MREDNSMVTKPSKKGSYHSRTDYIHTNHQSNKQKTTKEETKSSTTNRIKDSIKNQNFISRKTNLEKFLKHPRMLTSLLLKITDKIKAMGMDR